MKKCSKCNRSLPEVAFGKSAEEKDGLQAYCKTCNKEYQKQYRPANKDKIAKHDKKYYAANKGKVANRKKKYRAENKDKIAKQAKKYQATNKDKIGRYRKKYRVANKDKMAEYGKKYLVVYRAANKDKLAKRAKEYYAKNKDKIALHRKKYYAANKDKKIKYRAVNRGKYRGYEAKRRARVRLAILPDCDMAATSLFYDTAANAKRICCFHCHKPIKKGQRHIDHLVPLSKGGLHCADNLVVSCAVCNMHKHTRMPNEVGLLTLDFNYNPGKERCNNETV